MDLAQWHQIVIFSILFAALTVGANFDQIQFTLRAEELSKRLRDSALSTLRDPHLLAQNSSQLLLEQNLVEPFVDYSVVNATAVVQQITDKLTNFFQVRVDALLAAVREAEDIVLNHTTVSKIENVDSYFSLEIKEYNWKVPANLTSLPEFKSEVYEPASTVYVTRDVYYRDTQSAWLFASSDVLWKAPHVVNGIAWTLRLDKIWKENRERRNITGWQYFGSRSGFVRTYPGYKWNADGEDNVNYNPAYDIRRFPWYGQGVSSPKDILLLIDTSGSVYGQPLQYMKIAAFSFIEMLSENDYVNVMTFNMQAQLVTPLINTFVPASERNKKMLKRYLDSVMPLNQGMYAGAFESAFQLFDGKNFSNASEFLSENFGANCNQHIILLSDGGTEFPEEVFKEMNWNRRAPKAPAEDPRWMNVSTDADAQAALKFARSQRRVFSYALGQQQNPTTALKKIACTNRGYFKHILDIGAIKTVLERYLEVLQRPMLEKMESTVTYSNRYYEQDGMGYVVSVLAPVYNRTDEKDEDGYPLASVLGLMANDISLTQIMNETIEPIMRQLGSNGYVFMINQNGFAIFHPRLSPMDDLLVMSGGNIKDRQVNDGVDLLDLEFDDEARQSIRRRMIDGESGSVTLEDALMRCTHNDTALYRATVTYTFGPIRGTPFSVGVVMPQRGLVRRTVSFASGAEGEDERIGDDSPFFAVADAERKKAAFRLLRATIDALTLPMEVRGQNATNRNSSAGMHYHSMTLPTQIEFCRSLPTAPWSTKVAEASAEGSKGEADIFGGDSNGVQANSSEWFENAVDSDLPSELPITEGTQTAETQATVLPTDSNGKLSDKLYPNSVDGGEADSAGGGEADSADPGLQAGRGEDESLAFLRFVYAHFDTFTEKLKQYSENGSIEEFARDCGTPETYQLFVDAVAMQPIITNWMQSQMSESGGLNLTEGVLSKMIISAHSLVAGYPKTLFDEYLYKSWFTPIARHNTLYETAVLSTGYGQSKEKDFMYLMHFEVLRAAGESPRLFAISPLISPVPKLTRLVKADSKPNYVLGVAVVEVNTGYFDQMLDGTVPECAADALCYLVDEYGYVLASSALARQAAARAIPGGVSASNNAKEGALVGAPLLEANTPLFLALLHDGAFIRTGFYFTQEKCESPSQLVGASAGNSPFSFAFWSRIFSFVSMHVSQLVSTSFWTDSFASLFSNSQHSLFLDFADAAGPSKGGRKSGRKKKKGASTQQQAEEEDERRCVLNVTRFALNRSAFEVEGETLRMSGKFRCDGNCEKPYAITAVPGTSIFLVMTAANFTCSIVRHSHANSDTGTNSSSQSVAFTDAPSPSLSNFTVTSFDANCALVNGVLNSSMLNHDHDHSVISFESGIRLETEVKVGDAEYATRMRKRYRRRPSVCYDYWVDENPNCGTWSLFSFSASLRMLSLCNIVLLLVRRLAY